MLQIPRDPAPDATLALALDPYGFIPARCRRLGSDVFQTRLLLRKTICMTGRDAAAVFYDPQRVVRRGAVPARVQKTLFGGVGVQAMDGEDHRRHKAMLLSLMMPDRLGPLIDAADAAWRGAARRWASRC